MCKQESKKDLSETLRGVRKISRMMMMMMMTMDDDDDMMMLMINMTILTIKIMNRK
jgi:hypothetical protein